MTRKVNPCKYVIIPKSGEKHKIQAYSLEEVKTILSRAQKENKKMIKRKVDEYKKYTKQLHQKKHSIHNF